MCFFFFFKQKTAYEMRISDWSSDVCSSDLTIAGCASIGDAKPPPLFFALTEIGLLVARLPRAMTIDRFNRLCRHSAKCRPISWNWRPIRKLGRYPAQVHHIRECAHRISTPREADQNDAIARLIVGNDLGVAVDHIVFRSEENTAELQSLMRITYG